MPDLSGLVTLFKAMAWTLAITIPLGLWKAVEIVVWAVHHVHIQWA